METLFRRIASGSLLLLLIWACHQAELSVVPQPDPSPASLPTSPPAPVKTVSADTLYPLRSIDPALIEGDVSLPVKSNFLADWLLNVPSLVEFGQLAEAGKPVTMRAFGDGLVAGWRDGGLYREGQLSAFPNLIARQLGITDFKSPLFDQAHGNGTGYVVLSRTTPEPRWKTVNNNNGILSRGELPELALYQGGAVDNWGVPKLSPAGESATLSPSTNGWVYQETGKGYTYSMPFFWRVLPGLDRNKVSYSERALEEMSQRPATVTLCAFQHDWWINEVVKSQHARPAVEETFNENSASAIGMAREAQKRGSKAVVYTLPNFKHLAYFNWYPASELANANVSYISQYGDKRGAGAQVLYLPTANVARLFGQVRAGQTVSATLNDSDVVTTIELNDGSPTSYNDRLRWEARRQGTAVVDLEALYQQIAEGRYVTDDGLAIDGSPRGNFFSADGIYPSLIGQAVIANETIKVLNQSYNANIPLIRVRELLNR